MNKTPIDENAYQFYKNCKEMIEYGLFVKSKLRKIFLDFIENTENEIKMLEKSYPQFLERYLLEKKLLENLHEKR